MKIGLHHNAFIVTFILHHYMQKIDCVNFSFTHNDTIKMKQLTLFFVCTILMVSCSQKEADKKMVSMAVSESDMAAFDDAAAPAARQAAPAEPSPTEISENSPVDKKKIIKDGRISLRVNDLDHSKMRTDSLVKEFGGYYANESYNNTDWESSYYLKIRIPGQHFERFISRVESGQDEILFKAIDARDVTDQFIDLETRLENKRKYMNRYSDLLKQATTIKDILEVAEKIRQLEEEIESTTGRLRYLNDLVDYSTLDLTLTKQKDFRYKPADRDNFLERLKQSLTKGWHGLVDGFLFVINLWPFLIIAALALYFWKRFKKFRNMK